MGKPKILMIFMILLFLSPAFAYTLHDGNCEGLEDSAYYYWFNTAPVQVNAEGEAVILINTEVDTSYNADINDTARRFRATGNESDGFNFRFDLASHGFNDSVGFDIDVIEFDLYNVTMENLYSGSDIHIYNQNGTAEILFDFIFKPTYAHESGDHLTMRFERKLWCQVLNDTTWDVLEDYSDLTCPYEFQKIDEFLINIPYPDVMFSSDADDWTVDLAIDNMVVKAEETESKTRDCEISYDQLSDIPDYEHYINVEGLCPQCQSDGWLGEAQFWYATLPDFNYGFALLDGSGKMINFKVIPYDQWYSKGENGSHWKDNFFNVSCFFDPDENQYPTWYDCSDGIENSYRSATADEKTAVKDSYVIANDETEFGDHMARFLGTNYQILSTTGRHMINDSYFLSGGDVRHKAYYCDLGFSNCSHVNETWDSLSNFTMFRYSIDTDNFNVGDYFNDPVIYFVGDNPDFENNEGLNIIIEGWGFEDVDYRGTGSGITGLVNSYVSDYNRINYIGDGICSDMESDIPSDWNYSPDCRLGGLTGYASAVGVQQSQILMVMAGAFVIVISVVGLATTGITISSLIMGAFGIMMGIILVIISSGLVLTP